MERILRNPRKCKGIEQCTGLPLDRSVSLRFYLLWTVTLLFVVLGESETLVFDSGPGERVSEVCADEWQKQESCYFS